MGILDISSYKSLWRGYDYYNEKKVNDINKLSETEFDAQVSNNEDNIYKVHLNIKHPRKSTCNCPHAKGKRIICKHMVASFFAIFPEKAKEYIEEIERYEEEEEERFQQSLIIREERIKDIEKYLNKLTKKELKEKLLDYMIDSEFYDDDLY